MSFKKLFFVLILFFAFSFLLRSDNSFDQDLGRHIKLGEIIVNTHQIPNINLFSYTNPEFPFINSHYLFEIFTYLGNQYLGIQLLLVLKILIILTAVGIILSLCLKSFSPLTLPIAYLFLHVLRERVDLRPEIFSFLFTAITYYILDRFEIKKSKLIWLLPVVQLIWVNTHIYFPVGLILQVIFLIHLTYISLRSHLTSGKLKFLGIILGLSVIASLINPNGLKGFFYPLQVFGNYGYTIAENQSMSLLESLDFKDPNFLFVKLSAFIIILSVFVGLFRHTLSIKNILLCLAGLSLALSNIRSFPYLVFLALPATLENIGVFKKRNLCLVVTIVVSALIFLESQFYLSGDYYKYTNSDTKVNIAAEAHGEKALDFVLANNLPQPIFNNFDIGSYIIYRGYPKYRVFVDGRPEAYPKDFFQQVYIPIQTDSQKFDELDKKVGFQTIIFSITDQTPWGQEFFNNILINPDWKTVYLDDFMIILVKNNVAQEKNLSLLDLSNLKPGNYQFTSSLAYTKMSLFLLNTGNILASESFAKKAVEIFPDSPIANLILANLVSQSYYQKAQTNVWW